MKITVDKETYRLTHGTDPKGYGWWIFQVEYYKGMNKVTENKTRIANCSQALKAIKKEVASEAKKNGCTAVTITVLP